MKKLLILGLVILTLTGTNLINQTRAMVLSTRYNPSNQPPLPIGATFTVKSTADTVDAQPGNGVCADTCGNCTLRAAIMEANAFLGDDTINFDAAVFSVPQTIKLSIPGVNEDYCVRGDLDITTNLTITGAGANITTIDGAGIDRVLDIRPDITTNVHISGLTVTGGKSLNTSPGGGSGGGIITHGSRNTLTLTNVTVSGNTADYGGGIFVAGPVTLNNCTVSGNSGYAGGGGINNYINGPLILNNSTVSGNSAGYGGGIGGSNHGPPLTLNNSTVTGNTTPNGVGMGLRSQGTVVLKNTILANTAGLYGNCDIITASGNLVSLGHNLSTDNSCQSIGTGGLNKPTDLNNTPAQLAPLALNSPGSTTTHALLPGSPAVDKGGDCLPVDQRGVPRPQGAACDIGAYEVGDATPPESTITSGPPALIKSSSATFTFVSNETGSFQCQLDAGGFAACTSPKSYNGLGDGSHTLQVRAIDLAGNADPTAASATWTVDSTPPDTNINSALDGNGAAPASGGSTLSNSITLNFGGTDAVGVMGFQCSLDGAAYGPCTSPVGHSALSLGSHVFQVRALDAADNVDASPASYTWTVVTPAQASQNLITAIDNLGLAAGVANSLTAPLGQASQLLNDNNPNNDSAACGKLNAFINQIDTKVQNGQLTSAQSSQLLQTANALKTSLGC